MFATRFGGWLGCGSSAPKAVAVTLKCGTLIDGISSVERHQVLIDYGGQAIAANDGREFSASAELWLHK